jgi:hypothetical protein
MAEAALFLSILAILLVVTVIAGIGLLILAGVVS